MRLIKSTALIFAMLFTIQSGAMASGLMNRSNALDMYKKYINNIVERVEKTKDPAEKRKVLNKSFDNLISVFDKVSNMGLVSSKDKKALKSLRSDVMKKKNELNGVEGYKRVSDQNLNNFANYVQQDMEQADTLTISISATLLVLIIILLLLL